MANTVTPLNRSFCATTAVPSTASAYTITASTVSVTPVTCGSAAVANALGAKLLFAGVGADGDTYKVKVYAQIPLSNSADYGDTAYSLMYMGEASLTLGTLTFVSAAPGMSGTTLRVADTVTWTPGEPYSTLCTAASANTGTEYSPADNTPAYIFLPYLANAAMLVTDFDMTGATSGIVYVQPGTTGC